MLVRDQIDVSLPIACFDVLQAVPFFRWRPERLGQDFEFAHFQRRLAGFGQETGAFDADEIAEIEQIEDFHCLGADFFLVEVGLNPAGRVSKIDKVTLAHIAMRSDSAGGAKRFAFLECVPDFRDRAGCFKSATKRLHSAGAKCLEFLPALRDQFVFRFHAVAMIMVERRSCQVPVLVPLCDDVTL